MSRKKLLVLAIILATVLIILTLLLPACSNTTASSTPYAATTTPVAKTAKKGGTFRIIDGRGPSVSIGWYADPNFRSGLWAAPLAEGFLECDLSGNVKPKLATNWEVASDLKSLKLTLRKGVKFHDGADFNATAAKWNLDQAISAKASGTADWTTVDIIDDNTIRINVKNYLNTMLNTLSSGTGYVVSPTAFQKVGAEGLRWNPVNTGPFKLTSFQRDVNIKYTRFNDYWQKDKPYCDAMEMNFISDMSTASMSFQTNADAFNGNGIRFQYDLIQKGYSGIKALDSDAFLMPDSKNTDSPFSNIKVRQALDYAVDRDSIVKARGFTFQQSTYQFALGGTSSYITNLQNRSYNPDTAKKLLAEAGYPSGFKTTLYVDGTVVDRDEAVAVQSFLGQVGIDADYQLMDAMKAVNIKTNGWKNGLYMGNLGIDANPNATLTRDFVTTSPSYPTLLRTADFNNLVQATVNSKTFDPELIKKVNQYIYDTAMITFLWGNSHVIIVQPYVRDTGFMSMQTWPLWQPANTWLDK
jgi:peptide/nickel transport system substrate-binding protein